MSAPTKVLVIDDSAVVRGMLSKIIKAEPGLELAGTAANGELGIDKAARLAPDVIVLDIEMPVMGGLEALVHLRRRHPKTPIIMFSTLTAKGAAASLDALQKGASDYSTKPSNTSSAAGSIELVREDLIKKILSIGKAVERPSPANGARHLRLAKPRQAKSNSPVDALLIGSSTGGPVALEVLLRAIPKPLSVPILIVQHMPPTFTGVLAERLSRVCTFPVIEAEDGMQVEAGACYLAAGGRHMTLNRQGPSQVQLKLNDDERVKSCRPSVDVMFDSARDVYQDRLVAAVLTGMGDDGLDASVRLAALDVEIIIQDEETSVVWGMPGAIANAGIADQCLPLDQIAPALLRVMQRRNNSLSPLQNKRAAS